MLIHIKFGSFLNYFFMLIVTLLLWTGSLCIFCKAHEGLSLLMSVLFKLCLICRQPFLLFTACLLPTDVIPLEQAQGSRSYLWAPARVGAEPKWARARSQFTLSI